MIPIALSVTAGVVSLAPISVPGFEGLGDLGGGEFFSIARDVSDDGRTVVGASAFGSFVWTRAEGMIEIRPSQSTAFGVSGDGSTIVGYTGSGPLKAARWVDGQQQAIVGRDESGVARGASADGRIVVGDARIAAGTGAFRWTPEGGVTLLGGPGFTIAHDISSDNSTIVGVSSTGFEERQAARWIDGDIELLGDLPGGTFESVGLAVSGDGGVVVGHATTSVGREAFRWSSTTGMVGLGDLPGGASRSEAFGVSDDARVIVGRATSESGQEAFVWQPDEGMRSLAQILTGDLKVDLEGWRLLSAEAVSADGLIVVGYGINPFGQTEAFLATIPAPGALGWLGSAAWFHCRRRR